jgi:hypothetical protein
MSGKNTLLLNGQPVEVTPNNWQQIAKARLDQDAALSPENKLAEYQAIQQMAGVNGPKNYTIDANGAAVANTAAFDALQNTYAVQGATAFESGEAAIFGQPFVDQLHADSAYVWEKGAALVDSIKSGAAKLPDYFSGLNSTVQLALAVLAIGGVGFIIWKVKQ